MVVLSILAMPRRVAGAYRDAAPQRAFLLVGHLLARAVGGITGSAPRAWGEHAEPWCVELRQDSFVRTVRTEVSGSAWRFLGLQLHRQRGAPAAGRGRVTGVNAEIAVPRQTILEVARLLERWVVSEDRIGSSFAGGSVEDADREAGSWHRESGVLRTASWLRVEMFRLLGYYDPVEGDDDAVIAFEEECEREFGDVGCWTRQVRDETSPSADA
jgi:hypothetical protein